MLYETLYTCLNVYNFVMYTLYVVIYDHSTTFIIHRLQYIKCLKRRLKLYFRVDVIIIINMERSSLQIQISLLIFVCSEFYHITTSSIYN